jgi:hypothetical protein
MSHRPRTVLFCVVLAGIAATASAFLIARASSERARATQVTTQGRTNRRETRNLFLQPEALGVARRLGKRFIASTRATSTTSGILTVSGSEQPLTITRRQTDTGEQVELLVQNRSLTWNDQEGTKSGAVLLTDADRLLAERLTLDSPDQFVLAQLRGSSYFTVAQNVRLNDAQDGYTGPSWTQVRVNDVSDKNQRMTSRWRLYYINSTTGLIDRVVSELNGQRVEAEITEWIEQNGEKSPARIVWTAEGQIIMSYRLITFTLTTN